MEGKTCSNGTMVTKWSCDSMVTLLEHLFRVLGWLSENDKLDHYFWSLPLVGSYVTKNNGNGFGVWIGDHII